MKSQSHTLVTELEQKELQLDQLDVESIDPDVRTEAMLHAGIDKYVGGVGFFRLTAPFRGHKQGSLVVRHINSSGMHVTVCESPIADTVPTSTKSAEQLRAEAAAAAVELDKRRAEQAAKDAAAKAAKDAAANDNKEAPAAAPATGTATP